MNMKFVISAGFIILFASISFSCKPTVRDRSAERNERSKEAMAMYSEAYFLALQDSLELDDIQLSSLKEYNTNFKYQIRSRRLKGELTPEEKKKLRKNRNEKMKKELGVKVYKEKLAFDKIWLERIKSDNAD